MTRLLWYHWLGGSAATLVVFLITHNQPSCLAVRVPVLQYKDPFSTSVIAGLLLTLVLLFNTARLVIKTARTDRSFVYLSIYALALSPFLVYFSARAWTSTLAILLLVLSLLNACDFKWGRKPVVLSAIYLAGAAFISGPLFYASIPILLFLAWKRTWRSLFDYTAVFGAILIALTLIGGRGADTLLEPMSDNPFRGVGAWIGTLRVCASSHLSLAYIPFILTAAAGTTVRENRHNGAVLFLILLLSFLFGTLLPGGEGTVVSVMAAYILFVVGANCGAIMLCELSDDKRLPHLRIAVVGLFLLPPVVSTLIAFFR